jgi:hypothetical protein
MTFKQYLTEAASEERLQHLEHAEDHIIHSGASGFAHAAHNLEDVHGALTGKKNKTTIMTKYDGSPSIVFGNHPETGKFFVASKSAWNATPKINHTEEDIDANHGHTPGLAAKLKTALQHLPKITPPTGVYQGDMMHSGLKTANNDGDVESHSGKYHFQANPSGIKYSTPVDSEEGKKIKRSKMGVVVHTAYHGPTFQDMKVDYSPDLSHFKQHADVHMIDNRNDVPGAKITPKQEAGYQKEMDAARKLYAKIPKQAYKALEGNEEHLSTYINKSVRDQKDLSHEGLVKHVGERMSKEVGKMKSQKGIEQKTEAMHSKMRELNMHADHLGDILKLHGHVQAAKNHLVGALASNPKYEHTMAGEQTKPEGFVVVRNNRPTKLVDRAEFSRNNLMNRSR